MAQTINVDISTRGAPPVAYTHQGDTDRTFLVNLFENGEDFAVAGFTVKVAAILPGDGGYSVISGADMVSATKTTTGTNQLMFTPSAKYTARSGRGILTLIMTTNTGTPATLRPINIDFRIQKSADGPDVIEGASDFPEGLEAIAEQVFQEYLNTYLPPVAPSSSADANKAASAKLTGQELDNLKSDLEKQFDADVLTKYFRDNVSLKIWNNGNWVNYTPRLSTTVPVSFPYDVSFNCPWYSAVVKEWSSVTTTTETFVKETTYNDGFVVPANTLFTVTFGKQSNADFSLSDADKIVVSTAFSELKNDVVQLNEKTGLVNGFVLGDFYNGNVVQSPNRMINSKPEIITASKVFTTDFTKYRIYVWERTDGSWVRLGWYYEPVPVFVGRQYMFVVAVVGTEPPSLSSDQQADIIASSNYIPFNEYLNTYHKSWIEKNASDISANTIMFDICPTVGGFATYGNKNTNDALVVRTGGYFYTRALSGGQAYAGHSCDNIYMVNNNQCLAYRRSTQTLSVISASALIPTDYVVLLWKQGTTIKGLWASYYAISNAPSASRKYHRLMNRQGEGYGYPDNSLEGVLAAVSDGYSMVRISVAHTSDNVFYCTHSYEMQHNSQYGYLKQNGVAYASDVNINSVTSEFIDSLTYKDYTIPKLSDMLAALSLYDLEITIELKDSNTATTAQMLLDQLNYNNLKYVISGTHDQLTPFVAIDTNLNIAVIFEYTDTAANGYMTEYNGKCKSLRFDCYWSDTISEASVKNTIHPSYKIKLGGGTGAPTADNIGQYIAWADIAEVTYVYSSLA